MQNVFSRGCGGHAALKKIFLNSIMRFRLVEILTNLRSFQIAQHEFAMVSNSLAYSDEYNTASKGNTLHRAACERLSTL